jgi:hypothetical protein
MQAGWDCSTSSSSEDSEAEAEFAKAAASSSAARGAVGGATKPPPTRRPVEARRRLSAVGMAMLQVHGRATAEAQPRPPTTTTPTTPPLAPQGQHQQQQQQQQQQQRRLSAIGIAMLQEHEQTTSNAPSRALLGRHPAPPSPALAQHLVSELGVSHTRENSMGKLFRSGRQQERPSPRGRRDRRSSQAEVDAEFERDVVQSWAGGRLTRAVSQVEGPDYGSDDDGINHAATAAATAEQQQQQQQRDVSAAAVHARERWHKLRLVVRSAAALPVLQRKLSERDAVCQHAAAAGASPGGSPKQALRRKVSDGGMYLEDEMAVAAPADADVRPCAVALGATAARRANRRAGGIFELSREVAAVVEEAADAAPEVGRRRGSSGAAERRVQPAGPATATAPSSATSNNRSRAREYEVLVPPGALGMLLREHETAAYRAGEQAHPDLVVVPCVGWAANPLSKLIAVHSTLVEVGGVHVRGLRDLRETSRLIALGAQSSRSRLLVFQRSDYQHGQHKQAEFLQQVRATRAEPLRCSRLVLFLVSHSLTHSLTHLPTPLLVANQVRATRAEALRRKSEHERHQTFLAEMAAQNEGPWARRAVDALAAEQEVGGHQRRRNKVARGSQAVLNRMKSNKVLGGRGHKAGKLARISSLEQLQGQRRRASSAAAAAAAAVAAAGGLHASAGAAPDVPGDIIVTPQRVVKCSNV